MLALYRTALVLTIIGALNWLSVGLFRYDFVGALLMGTYSAGARTIFTIVGIAGIVLIYYLVAPEAIEGDRRDRTAR